MCELDGVCEVEEYWGGEVEEEGVLVVEWSDEMREQCEVVGWAIVGDEVDGRVGGHGLVGAFITVELGCGQ